MKLQLVIVAGVAGALIGAGAAAAAPHKGFGGGWPDSSAKRTPSMADAFPQKASEPSRHRSYTVPEAQPFKPYKPKSVYSHPSGYGAAHGAKDCELSVYVNACGRR
jgi:hypothetical protein